MHYDERVERLLEELIFLGLEKAIVEFDRSATCYFRPETFLCVLERCERFKIEVCGVEMFGVDGTYFGTEFDTHVFTPWVSQFRGREDLLFSGSFVAPELAIRV